MMSPSHKFKYEFFLVVFLDVLGQTRRLHQLPDHANADSSTIHRILRDTLGFVLALRENFERYFDAFGEETSFARSLPANERAALKSLTGHEILLHGFSDSITIAVPLGKKDDPLTPINGVRAALLASGAVSLLATTVKQVLRGGIDIAPAVHIAQGEIYGPALASAYMLENSVAQYPRIVVGNGLVQYLAAARSQPQLDRRSQVAAKVAEVCEGLLFEDRDGQLAVDYLGAAFKEQTPGPPEYPQVIATGLEWLLSERDKLATTGQPDVAQKYARMAAYIDSRRHVWGF